MKCFAADQGENQTGGCGQMQFVEQGAFAVEALAGELIYLKIYGGVLGLPACQREFDLSDAALFCFRGVEHPFIIVIFLWALFRICFSTVQVFV